MSYSLRTTKKYSQFELCEFNRDIRKTKKLEVSMQKHGWIPAYPMHVVRNGDTKLRIKAGHHRFQVGQKLGLAAYYVVCDDDATVLELEVETVRWSFNDFLTSYCRIGSKPHMTVVKYAEHTGISPGQIASMLGGESASSGNMQKKVKDGTFEVKTTAHCDAVCEIVLACKEIGLKFATQREFVSALSTVVWLPEFDSGTFLHRLAISPGLIKREAKIDDYLSDMEVVYNRQAKKKMALAFLAREAARERAVFKK